VVADAAAPRTVAAQRLPPNRHVASAQVTKTGEPLNQVAPDLALGPDHILYVVWAEGREGQFNVRMTTTTDRGATFTAPVPVNSPHEQAVAGWQEGPQIVVDRVGTVYVLWVGAHEQGIRLARSTDGGRTFERSVRVGERIPARQTYPSVAVDSSGAIYVAWLDSRLSTKREPPHEFQVFFSKSTDGGKTFTPDRSVTPNDPVGVCDCCRTAIEVGPGGEIVMLYRDVDARFVRDIAMVRSTDGGATFRKPVPVSASGWQFGGCPADGPSLGIDGSGQIHAAWMDGREGSWNIYYAVSRDGRSFSEAQRVNVDPTLAQVPRRAVWGSGGHPALGLASSGGAWIVWEDKHGGGKVYLAHASAGTVSSPLRVDDAQDPSPRSYPRVVVDEAGIAYVAWMDRRGGASEIYLSVLPPSEI